jgi:nucleoside 2-deoxyribosyltransferase
MIYTNSKLIYLASPYSHPDPVVVLERFHEVCRWSAALLADNINVISPIAHSHPISVASEGILDPLNWEVWQKLDFTILDRCDQLWLCNMDGWRNSVGCKAEVQRARSQGKPCRLLTPNHKGDRFLQNVEVSDFRV